jgi:ribose 5-phosphate isomerase B
MTRLHNDANVLCFGARVVGEGLALDLVDAFLDAEFMGDKHQKRVEMLTAIELAEAAK